MRTTCVFTFAVSRPPARTPLFSLFVLLVASLDTSRPRLPTPWCQLQELVLLELVLLELELELELLMMLRLELVPLLLIVAMLLLRMAMGLPLQSHAVRRLRVPGAS